MFILSSFREFEEHLDNTNSYSITCKLVCFDIDFYK